jgi:hypothetical protein
LKKLLVVCLENRNENVLIYIEEECTNTLLTLSLSFSLVFQSFAFALVVLCFFALNFTIQVEIRSSHWKAQVFSSIDTDVGLD